jgi:hypothetical protein
MDIVRVVLLALHIIAAGTWIAQFPAELGFRMALRGSRGKPVELPILIAQGRVLNMMGQIGGIGILLTGFGLIGIERLGFLNIGGITPNWLLFKQIIYLAAMLIAFAVLMPAQRRLRPLIVEAVKGTPTVTPEIRQLMDRSMMASRLVNLLVLVNVVLGVWKPG